MSEAQVAQAATAHVNTMIIAIAVLMALLTFFYNMSKDWIAVQKSKTDDLYGRMKNVEKLERAKRPQAERVLNTSHLQHISLIRLGLDAETRSGFDSMVTLLKILLITIFGLKGCDGLWYLVDYHVLGQSRTHSLILLVVSIIALLVIWPAWHMLTEWKAMYKRLSERQRKLDDLESKIKPLEALGDNLL